MTDAAEPLWRRLLAQAWAELGGPDGAAGRLVVTGDPRGRLPSRLPAGDTAIACAGAALLWPRCAPRRDGGRNRSANAG